MRKEEREGQHVGVVTKASSKRAPPCCTVLWHVIITCVEGSSSGTCSAHAWNQAGVLGFHLHKDNVGQKLPWSLKPAFQVVVGQECRISTGQREDSC